MKEWSNRSFDVVTADGTVYRRNSKHINKTNKMPPVPVEYVIESTQ